MCTVTFIPAGDRLYITSNRDENRKRPAAIRPMIRSTEKGRILFPRDTAAGGTWFAAHENGNVLVLLNGARIKHAHLPPYRRSRGLLLLELAEQPLPLEHFLTCPLEGIEPFTLVLLQQARLFEGRWDGSDRQYRELKTDQPHIWSSVTLYEEPAIALREKWFEDWLAASRLADGRDLPDPSSIQEEIMRFHRTAGQGDGYNDLLMHRDNGMCTVSITSLQWSGREARMSYLDLGQNADLAQNPDLPTPTEIQADRSAAARNVLCLSFNKAGESV